MNMFRNLRVCLEMIHRFCHMLQLHFCAKLFYDIVVNYLYSICTYLNLRPEG